jgi:hypothetical protein
MILILNFCLIALKNMFKFNFDLEDEEIEVSADAAFGTPDMPSADISRQNNEKTSSSFSEHLLTELVSIGIYREYLLSDVNA